MYYRKRCEEPQADKVGNGLELNEDCVSAIFLTMEEFS